MIRLSICIATLNRAAFIGETLCAILEQMTDEVEVIVLDGASTDGTDRIVGNLFSRRVNCHYHRLSAKGGVDLDYCRSVELARGEFCWLMTDDDLIKPEAIGKILNYLGSEIDLLLLNSEVANADLSKMLLPSRLQIETDREFGPAEQGELLAVTGDLLSFIGTVVIRRSTWLARDPIPFLGTEFVHVGMIFQRPLVLNALALADPLIRIRYGNAQWLQRTFDIWMFNWPELIWSFRHLPDDAKQKVVTRAPYRKLGALFGMKVRGYFCLRDYRTKLAGRQMGFITRALAVALAGIPDILFNAFCSLVVAPLRRWSPMARQELEDSPFNYRKRWF